MRLVGICRIIGRREAAAGFEVFQANGEVITKLGDATHGI